KELCYLDADNDNYRPSAGATVVSNNLSCLDSGEAVPTDPIGDCNDSSAAIRPGAAEIVGDAIDQNCDGFDACYQDLDDDNYGSATVVTDNDLNCANASAATATVSGDCNDSLAGVNPGATEVVDSGIDENCNGQ